MFPKFSYSCFAEIYRAQYGNAMLLPTKPPWHANMAAGKKRNHLEITLAI